jgi:ParB family chromosome partitioning protein
MESKLQEEKPKKEIKKPLNVDDEFTSIDIDEIIIESNVREKYNDDSLKELSESIKQFGVLQPIRVYPKGDKYVIIFGHRRYLANKLAENKFIKCVITEKPETVDNIIIQITENEHNEKLSSSDLEKYIKLLKDEHKLSVEEISKKLGKAPSTIYGYLESNKARSKYEEKFSNAGLTLSSYDSRNIKNGTDKEIDDVIEKVTICPENKVKILEEFKKSKVKNPRNNNIPIENNPQTNKNIISFNIKIILNDKDKTFQIFPDIKGFYYPQDLTINLLSSLENFHKENGYNLIKNLDN